MVGRRPPLGCSGKERRDAVLLPSHTAAPRSTVLPPKRSRFGHVVHHPESPLWFCLAVQQRSPLTPKRCALSLCRPAHCGSPFPSSGFLRGEQSAEPQLIAFHPCFQKGALLTVVSAASAPGGLCCTPAKLCPQCPRGAERAGKATAAHCSVGWRCPVLIMAPLSSPVLVHGDHQPHPLLLPEHPRALRQPWPQPRRGDGQQQRAGAAALLGALTAAYGDRNVQGLPAVLSSLGHHRAAVPSCAPRGSVQLHALIPWQVGLSTGLVRIKGGSSYPIPRSAPRSVRAQANKETFPGSFLAGGCALEATRVCFHGLWCCSVMPGRSLECTCRRRAIP